MRNDITIRPETTKYYIPDLSFVAEIDGKLLSAGRTI